MKKVFLLKGLDCPNCAAKIEKEVGAFRGVSSSEINLIKQTLTVEVDEDAASLAAEIEKTVHSHEPHISVTDITNSVPSDKDSSKNVKKEKNEEDEKEDRFTLLRLIIGAAVFAVAIVLDKVVSAALPLCLVFYITSYIIFGADVIVNALRNIVRGQIFDENFLMTLSTVGAFAIGEYPEAAAVMLFYQIGEYFQRRAVMRSRHSIASLMDIRPDFATVLRNGHPLTVSPENVAVGETVVIKPGERIPLDGIVTEGESMLDTKALTGEAVPKKVGAGDEVFSGCICQSGVLTVRVTKEYGESTVQKILELTENASARKAKAENFITTFARYYTPAVVIGAVILAVLPPLLLQGAWSEWLRRAMVFLVISCPCALVISVPLAFFGGIGAASKHGILIKGGNFLEALCKADTFAFDKTGTLTKGVFKVQKILPENGFNERQLLEYAAALESFSNHPIAKAVTAAYGKNDFGTSLSNFSEKAGHGITAVYGGKRIAVGNEKLMHSENVSCEGVHSNGTAVYVAVDGVFAGHIEIADELKEDSQRAISRLKEMGVKTTVMLTGDSEETARQIATAAGIDEYHAQLLPHQKVEILESIEKKLSSGSKLAFAGDGINDAPVLARAHIGIAMGALGSDAAIEAADVVLMTDELTKLPEAVKIARATRKIVIQNIVFSLGIKAAFLILGAFGLAGMWEAVFADVGVALIAVLNSMRILKK